MKVALIGSGISGLTFTAAPKRQAPEAEVTLFERDVSASSRPQGYAIGLPNGTGLAAAAKRLWTRAGMRDDSTRPALLRGTSGTSSSAWRTSSSRCSGGVTLPAPVLLNG